MNLNMSDVPYTRELKSWLLNKGFAYFMEDTSNEYPRLTPFKNLTDLSLFAPKSSIKQVDKYDNFDNAILNLSIGVIHSIEERSYVHLN